MFYKVPNTKFSFGFMSMILKPFFPFRLYGFTQSEAHHNESWTSSNPPDTHKTYLNICYSTTNIEENKLISGKRVHEWQEPLVCIFTTCSNTASCISWCDTKLGAWDYNVIFLTSPILKQS